MKKQQSLLISVLIATMHIAYAGDPIDSDQGGIGGTGNTILTTDRPETMDRPDLPDRIETVESIRPDAGLDGIPTTPDVTTEPPSAIGSPQP